MFTDDVELLAGDLIVERLNDAIHNCRYFIAFLSEAYLKSGWCKQEMLQMLTKEAQTNEVGFIPFRVGDCQIPQLLAARVGVRVLPLRTRAMGIRLSNGNANRVTVINFLSRLWGLVDNQSGLKW